jgi:hypothetical protein
MKGSKKRKPMYKASKKPIFFIFLAAFPLLLAHCGKQEKIRIDYVREPIQPLGYCLIDKHGKPCQALIELLYATTQGLKKVPCTEFTLPRIVDVTQKEWLRPHGSERWEIQETAYANRDVLIDLLDQLCLFNEINPHKQHYNYCFVLGAIAPSVRGRLCYIFKLWDAGVRFDNLIFLGSERPLDAQKDSAAVLLDRSQTILPIRCDWTQTNGLPTTEVEMMKFIFGQATLPSGFDQINIQFISTPMKENEDGSVRRPNTGDTIAQWLSTDPILGSCLFISNQPYVGYQDAVIRTYMPSAFEVDVVGSCANPQKQNIDVVLDTLARWLYQENLRRQSK